MSLSFIFMVCWLLDLGDRGYFSEILGKVVSGAGSKVNLSPQVDILFIIPLSEHYLEFA